MKARFVFGSVGCVSQTEVEEEGTEQQQQRQQQSSEHKGQRTEERERVSHGSEEFFATNLAQKGGRAMHGLGLAVYGLL